MKKVFDLPAWLLFTVLFIIIICASIASTISRETQLISGVVTVTLFMIYPYCIVNAINNAAVVKHSTNIFTISWLVATISFVLVLIALYIFEQEEINLGAPGLIFFAALVYTFLFTARLIKVMELKKDVPYSNCILLAIGLMFFPFNILFVHNRVKKIILSYNTVDAA